MSNGKEKGPIQPVGKKPADEIQQIIEREEALVKEAGQKKPASAETLDQIVRQLPKLIQRTLAKLETTQVYQTFKLPGRDYIVHDRREKADESGRKEKDPIAEESKRPLQELLIQKGKLAPARERGYENYLADPMGKMTLPLEQSAARERLTQFFSNFERLLLKRFEEGMEVAKKAKEGQFQFFKKTADQWRNFFARFVHRSVKRQIAAEQIQEWIFRGLVQKSAKSTLISDWALANGQLERFVRFHLPQDSQALLQMLAQLNPGVRLSKEELQKFLQGELEYLAIKAGEGDVNFAQAAQKGKFLKTAQAEEKVAGDLGIQLEAQLKEKTKLLKSKRGSGFSVQGSAFEEEEQESQFIPWWQRGPFQKHRGPLRWFMPVLYLVLVSLVVIGILSLI